MATNAVKLILPILSSLVLGSSPVLTGQPAVPAPPDTAFHAPGNFNPLVPGYFADPTIKQFGDTFYLYATTDGNGGGRGPATVWVSRDFVDWVLVPISRIPPARATMPAIACNTQSATGRTANSGWAPTTPFSRPPRMAESMVRATTRSCSKATTPSSSIIAMTYR